MAIVTKTLTVNAQPYKQTFSDEGYYIRRNDNKLFIDVVEPMSSTFTYEETSQMAVTAWAARLSNLEDKHAQLQDEHDALESKPHVIETYQNGTEWYRVYSDGWCETGGIIPSTATTTVTTNFLKEFKEAPSVLVNFNYSKTGTANYQYICARNITTTSFVITTYVSDCSGISYLAQGYISI